MRLQLNPRYLGHRNSGKWSPFHQFKRGVQTKPAQIAENEDDITRNIFDSPEYWSQFNAASSPSGSILDSFIKKNGTKSVGLFCNPYLTSPRGLKKFANETLEKARDLTTHMIEDQSAESLQRYIKELDRLSDMLCRVIDLCEFVRAAHPDSSFVKAAESCHIKLFEHMNVLNTSKPLFLKLQKVLYDSEMRVYEKLSNEELSVGKLLYDDFKKSGIDMDDKTGEHFVQLSSYISQAGQEFNNSITIPRSTSVRIPKGEWTETDLNPAFASSVSKSFDGSITIPLYGHVPYEILRSCPNSVIRKKLWVELHSVPDDQMKLLLNLLKCREILANLMGSKNYADYSLKDKMARSPENVVSFLNGLINDLRPNILKELRLLYKYLPEKPQEEISDGELSKLIKPWDREYLVTKHILSQKSSTNEDITNYFSLGTVVSGLSKLFHSIYGIKLVPQKLKTGEVWSSDVRRFDAVSDTDGKVGIMYLDLLQRNGKTPHPAHFTVCCSRMLDDAELNESDPFNLSLPTTATVETVDVEGKTYQLPVISLVCNYSQNHSKGVVCLTLDQVSTLFHEMGHAMHSMLGRTKLHNVSGTRCQTDFVELPSILHETFAKDERVLKSFGRHYKTGDRVPVELIRKHLNSDKILNYSETFGQAKMALLDQIYHGANDLKIDENFNLLKIYHELENELSFFSDTESSWPGKFGHLFSYGSLYYSYLLDRAIASKIWTKLFEDDPFNRKAGEKFKNEVLRWGGSRDPWLCISRVLDIKELEKGDANAMKLISKDAEKL